MAVQSVVSSQATPLIHNQEVLKMGVLQTTMDKGDQVMISSPRAEQVANDMGQETLDAAQAISIDPVQALSVHSKLDFSRAMSLLEGIDDI